MEAQAVSWKWQFIPPGEIEASQKRRWPEALNFEGKTLEEREDLISDWNVVQFGRHSIGKQNFVQKEGTPEERLHKEAMAWRTHLSRVAVDRTSDLQFIGKNITELPPEITLFQRVTHVNAKGHAIEFVPQEVGQMPLKSLDLSHNNLSVVPPSLFSLNVVLRGNKIRTPPESWNEFALSARFYPQKK